MIFATGILVVTGALDDGAAGAPTGGQMIAYVVGFILLFILSGIGNGSTYKMIPSIFEAGRRAATTGAATRRLRGRAACRAP